jgi:ribokinase
VGGAVFDLFIRPEQEKIIQLTDGKSTDDYLAFPHGQKLEIDDIHMEFGGGATNCAVNLSVMGFRTALVARIGDDHYGNEILANLAKYRVDASQVEVVQNGRSGFSVIINSFDGERTVFYSRGVNDTPVKKFLSSFTHFDSVHVTSLPKKSSGIFKNILKGRHKQKRLFLSWNPGYFQLKEGMALYKSFLKQLDVIFLNKEELTQFTGIPVRLYDNKTQAAVLLHCKSCLKKISKDDSFQIYDLHKAATKLVSAGVKMVVVTDSRRGAQIFFKKDHWFIPAGETKPVATLGAGDAFCSGFLAGYFSHRDPLKALEYATYNAGSVVGKYGAQQGILTLKQMEAKLGSLPLMDMHSI